MSITEPNPVPSSIRRSSSDPNLSKTKPSHLPPPTHSFPKGGGKSYFGRNGSKSVKRFDKFKMKNTVSESKNSRGCSHYKKLLPLTLCINLQRPWRESNGNPSTSTSSSISTVFTRIQKWGSSLFKSKGESKVTSSVSVKPTCATRMTKIVDKKEMKEGWKDVSSLEMSSLFEEKPSKERVLAVAATPPSVLFSKKVIVIQEKAKKVTTNDESKFVWANKYRPKALKDFVCNRDKAEQLQDLVKKEQCSHYIFEGPPGVGKRTMIGALLTEIFGPDRLQTREECKEFELKGEAVASIHVNVKVSSQHLEINLSELLGYEKHVIVSLIKETQSVVLSEARHCDHTNCRAIILYEADKLSTDAQLYIRWLMERYKGCNKIFFCCTDLSKLETVRSLCTVIQLLPPSDKEIIEVLEFISEQEGIELSHQLAERIATNSRNNLRQAVRSFEASWQMNYPFKEDQILMSGWEEEIANIAKNIIEEQSPKQLYIIRGKLQNFKEHDVSPNYVFNLKKHLDEQYHPQMDALQQDYDNRDDRSILNSEKCHVLMHNQLEELDKRINNPMGDDLHPFMKIEAFAGKLHELLQEYCHEEYKNVKWACKLKGQW